LFYYSSNEPSRKLNISAPLTTAELSIAASSYLDRKPYRRAQFEAIADQTSAIAFRGKATKGTIWHVGDKLSLDIGGHDSTGFVWVSTKPGSLSYKWVNGKLNKLGIALRALDYDKRDDNHFPTFAPLVRRDQSPATTLVVWVCLLRVVNRPMRWKFMKCKRIVPAF
jgi:hypothetical protein